MTPTPARLEVEERTPEFGIVPGLPAACPRDVSLEIFRKMAFIRAFEYRARQARVDGDVQNLVYLSVGCESIAPAIASVLGGSWVLPQHRGHATYLSFGGDATRLVDELLGLPTGSNRGMGGSPPIQDFERKIVGHVGLIGDQVPVAIGLAYARRDERVVCFLGDGAFEEDYVLGAIGFASTHELPILFVVEDNDLSVLTPVADRRAWKTVDVARGFEIPAVDITDDPWLIRHHVEKLAGDLPGLINVRTCRVLWHQGTGQDGPPEWDRYGLVQEELAGLGLARQAAELEENEKRKAIDLWEERLRRRSEISLESI